jgi:alpha-methylacyl-CoA racemase
MARELGINPNTRGKLANRRQEPWKVPLSDFIARGALEPQFFALLLDGLNIDRSEFVQYDRTSWPSMRETFERRFREKTRDDWAVVFEKNDTCVSPVLTMSEAALHPHAVAREVYIDIGGVQQPAPAPRFARTPGAALPARNASAGEIASRWRTRT